MAELTELAQALSDIEEERVYALIEAKLKEGVPPMNLVKECNAGMTEIGERFASQEYFLSELIFSAEILRKVMDRLQPLLQDAASDTSSGTMIIGTVKGDIHDVGKNIVILLLRGAGFEVIDMGVDVPAEVFVEKLKETGAPILGLSALLNTTILEMKNVVDAITAAGLRKEVKIIIGGAPVNEQVREYSGADYYASDAAVGLKICKQVYS